MNNHDSYRQTIEHGGSELKPSRYYTKTMKKEKPSTLVPDAEQRSARQDLRDFMNQSVDVSTSNLLQKQMIQQTVANKFDLKYGKGRKYNTNRNRSVMRDAANRSLIQGSNRQLNSSVLPDIKTVKSINVGASTNFRGSTRNLDGQTVNKEQSYRNMDYVDNVDILPDLTFVGIDNHTKDRSHHLR